MKFLYQSLLNLLCKPAGNHLGQNPIAEKQGMQERGTIIVNPLLYIDIDGP